ncbi:MAG: hypothetical protein JXR94_00820 [Candidatus Hydrogenedentes bacterium]|nr:hypothetical protein [Candidatus Hydrogenedentota bacterium]
MKTFTAVFVLSAGACMAATAPDAPELTRADTARRSGEGRTSMLEFVRASAARRYSRVPREVLAFYYTWYGSPERHGKWRHWADVQPGEHDIATSTHYPAKGAYDSHDPAIIDWHIDLARTHGITGFIATWWGQGTFDDRAFATVLERAAAKGFKASVYWEAAPGSGTAQIEQAVGDLLYILRRYGSHPAFLKVDGKPVIFVYGRVMGQVPARAWADIITETQAQYSGDFLLIADGYSEGNARLLDGVHTYNICGAVKGKTPEALRTASAEWFASAVSLARRHGKVSCITIIPGYDDTKIREPGLNAERQGGAVYRVLWEEAIAADPDWVIITSWNEWHEGSEIEPSWEDGDKYIKLTGEYAPQFLSTPFSEAKAPAGTQGASPEQAEALQALFRDTTVGLLPDFSGEVVFWLSDAGVPLRELTWEDLLDPAVFSPGALPVVLQAGGERFVQSVNESGDIERAIQRYLGEGGFLVAIPSAPFPFYYNEAEEAVVAARRLGLPIAGSGANQRDDAPEAAAVKGWEAPPEGVALTFHVDREALPGMPAAGPFPEAGDVRWRPATRALTAEGDVYRPLVQLRDGQGRSYGDAAAYVEHRASAPRGGRNLYVWMRTPEALGQNDAFFNLFRFVGQRLSEPKP